MNTLLIVAHPRPSSLCHQAARAFAGAAEVKGHVFEWLDLVAEGFDPVTREADEPDWDNPGKIYSPEVRAEMARVERHEATVMIFPVWGWSMPAILKGYVDRVWNHGWAYGAGRYPHRRVWLIGLAGVDRAGFAKRGYDAAMETQLTVGLLDYCGVAERRLELLYGTLDGAEDAARVLREAETLGAGF